MRIALTHNLQLASGEEEAEFDRPETIAALVGGLERLGHEVEPIEVSGPASRTVVRLEAFTPDLVFNTAEGRRGRFREAFYPALFEELGLPYTGSDAWVCALTLDKRLTKLLLAERGIPTPRSTFVERLEDARLEGLTFPLMVKPNFEGSSKGITQDSVAETPEALQARLAELLGRYPAGLLVEEYVVGRDITVPWLERAPKGPVLAAAEYAFESTATAGRRWSIYDYQLKQVDYNAVSVRVPAALEPELRARIDAYVVTAAAALGLRDLARFDFRVRDDGEPFFIEVNALPSLEPGASMYVAAAMQGLGSVESVLDVVVRSAAQRYGLALSTRTRRKKLRVGLLFNLKRASPSEDDDTEAEYDSPKTIAAIHEALESHGHEVVELEAMPELPRILPEAGIDLAFNISEGIRGRNRESQVPAILELLDIAYTGSDPAALSLALDKGLAKRVVAQAGLRTPPHVAMRSGKERLPPDFRFPAIVKPVHEGSSKGVDARCVVETEAEARSLAREMAARYRQPALVESFVSGREFTVALLGETRPKVLPPMEIVFLGQEKYPLYAYSHKLAWSEHIRYDAPASVEPGLRRELERMARGAFMALGCRDVARVDLRLDDQGRPCFIECNPLPGLTPDWSDLCIIANASGLGYRALIGEILAPAIRRLRARSGSRSSVW